MPSGLESLLTNPRRLRQFASTPGNYSAALDYASQGSVARRTASRSYASKKVDEPNTLETGEVIEQISLPDGSLVRPATESGKLVKVPGKSNIFVDPANGEPFQADPTKPTGLRSAYDTARQVKRDGKIYKTISGVGEREIGPDPKVAEDAAKAAAKREAENRRLALAREKRPYNIDRVTGEPVPLQSDEEWAATKQAKAAKLDEAARVKRLKDQADVIDLEADRISLTSPKPAKEDEEAFSAAESALSQFAAGQDMEEAAAKYAAAPATDEASQQAKAAAENYLAYKDKVKPAKEAEKKVQELKLRALDIKEQIINPQKWKAGKTASLAALPDDDLVAEVQAQAEIINEQEEQAVGTLDFITKGRNKIVEEINAFQEERQLQSEQGLSAEELEALNLQQARLEQSLADYDEHNSEAKAESDAALKAASDRRDVLAVAGTELEGRAAKQAEAAGQAKAKAETLAKAKPLYEGWAKGLYSDDWRTEEETPRLAQEAAKAGLDVASAKEALQTYRQLDWSNPRRDAKTGQPIAEEARTLPNGNVTVNPTMWGDAEAYKKAVEASQGTPEGKAKAIEAFPKLQEIHAEKAVEILSQSANIPGADNFMAWRERKIEEDQATQGKLGFARQSPAKQAIAYMDEMKNRSWFRKAGEQVGLGLLAGFQDIATQALGVGAMMTGSETLADLAAANTENTQSVVGAQNLEGSDTDYALRVMGMGARMTPAVAAMIAGAGAVGGGLGTAAVLAGGQTAGSMFADLYRTAKEDAGLSHGEAWRKAALPAALAGTITGLLTKGMGATGLERVFSDTATQETARNTFKAMLGQFVKGAAEELPEEIADEYFTTVLQESAASADPVATFKNFANTLPELAGVTALIGGAGALMQARRQTGTEGPGMAPPPEGEAPAMPVQPRPAGPAPTPSPETPQDVTEQIAKFNPTGATPLPQSVAATAKRTGRPPAAVARQAAAGVVKIAQGQSLESLDIEEQEALGFVNKGGKITPDTKVTPLVYLYKDKPVLRNAAAEWLTDEAQEGLAAMVNLSEAERKAQIDAEEAAAKAPAAKKKAGQAKPASAESTPQAGPEVKTSDSLSENEGSTPSPATTLDAEMDKAHAEWQAGKKEVDDAFNATEPHSKERKEAREKRKQWEEKNGQVPPPSSSNPLSDLGALSNKDSDSKFSLAGTGWRLTGAKETSIRGKTILYVTNGKVGGWVEESDLTDQHRQILSRSNPAPATTQTPAPAAPARTSSAFAKAAAEADAANDTPAPAQEAPPEPAPAPTGLSPAQEARATPEQKARAAKKAGKAKAKAPPVEAGPAPEAGNYLDRVLEAAMKDESIGELTIPVPEKNQNRADLDKAIAAIEKRGLTASTDGKSLLVRGFREMRQTLAQVQARPQGGQTEEAGVSNVAPGEGSISPATATSLPQEPVQASQKEASQPAPAAKSPEQMTPEEAVAVYGATYGEAGAIQQVRLAIKEAIKFNLPANAAFVDAYGITLPDGYTREGDLYVYRPAPSPAPASQPAGQAEAFKVGDFVRANGKGPVFKIESIGSDGWLYLANGQGSYSAEDAAKILVKSTEDAATKEAVKGGFPGFDSQPAQPPRPATPEGRAEAALAEYEAEVRKTLVGKPSKAARDLATRKLDLAKRLRARLTAMAGAVDFDVYAKDLRAKSGELEVKPVGRKGSILFINPEKLIDRLTAKHATTEAGREAMDVFILHEFIHKAAIGNMDGAKIIGLYNLLTPEAKAASKDLYLADSGLTDFWQDDKEFAAAHEWFAQLVEARLRGKISNQAEIEASQDPAFRDRLLALLRDFVAQLRDIAKLVTDKAQAARIEAEADAVQAIVADMAAKAGLEIQAKDDKAAFYISEIRATNKGQSVFEVGVDKDGDGRSERELRRGFRTLDEAVAYGESHGIRNATPKPWALIGNTHVTRKGDANITIQGKPGAYEVIDGAHTRKFQTLRDVRGYLDTHIFEGSDAYADQIAALPADEVAEMRVELEASDIFTLKAEAKKAGIELDKKATKPQVIDALMANAAQAKAGLEIQAGPEAAPQAEPAQASQAPVVGTPADQTLWADLSRFFASENSDGTRAAALKDLKAGTASNDAKGYLIDLLANPNYKGTAKSLAPQLIARLKATMQPAALPEAPTAAEVNVPVTAEMVSKWFRAYYGGNAPVTKVLPGLFKIGDSLYGLYSVNKLTDQQVLNGVPFGDSQMLIKEEETAEEAPALPASVTPAQAEAVAESGNETDFATKNEPYASPLAQFVGEWLGMNASQQSRVDMPQRVIRLAVNQADTEAVMQLVQDVGTKAADGQLLFNTPHQKIYNELREALRYTLRKGMGTEKDKVSTQLAALPDLTPPQTAAVAKEVAMPEPAKQAAPFDAAAAKGQKKFLLAEVAAAVKAAPKRADMTQEQKDAITNLEDKFHNWDSLNKEERKTYASELAAAKADAERLIGYVTIEVPGDGTFTILNEKEALYRFQKKADKFPVSQAKDDLPAKPSAQAPTAVPALKKAKTTADVVAAVFPMVSTDTTRGTILQKVKGDGTYLWATDGRVMVRVEQKNGGGKGAENIIYDEKGNAQPVPADERNPAMEQVIPDDKAFTPYTLDTARWFSLMSQARAVIKDLPGESESRFKSVSLYRNPDGSLGLFASDVNRGDYAHNIQPEAKILAAYSPDYFQTILRVARNLGNEQIELRIGDDVSPATLRAGNALFVLMPMRVNGAPAYSTARPAPLVTAEAPAEPKTVALRTQEDTPYKGKTPQELLEIAAPYEQTGENYNRNIAESAARMRRALEMDRKFWQLNADELAVRLEKWAAQPAPASAVEAATPAAEPPSLAEQIKQAAGAGFTETSLPKAKPAFRVRTLKGGERVIEQFEGKDKGWKRQIALRGEDVDDAWIQKWVESRNGFLMPTDEPAESPAQPGQEAAQPAANPRIAEIDAELANLQARYEQKSKQQSKGSMVPPAIKADALRGITKMMDKLDAEKKALHAAKQPAQPAQAPAPEGKGGAVQPITGFDSARAFIAQLRKGEVTAEQVRTAWAQLKAQRPAILADLMKMKVDELLPMAGISARKSDGKASIAKSALGILDDYFNPDGTISFSFGGNYQANKDAAMDEKVAKWTDELIAEQAKARREAAEERRLAAEAAQAAKEKALTNPETRAEWDRFVFHKGRTSLTREEEKEILKLKKRDPINAAVIRKGESLLTPEQLAAYDAVRGIDRKAQEQARLEAKSRVYGVASGVEADIIETKHTQKGHDLFVVKLSERVERPVYDRLNAAAKKLGGYYSSYTKGGAVPGFQFTTKAAAENFIAVSKGETVDQAEVIQERQEAKKSATATRLNAVADGLDAKADAILNADRKTNTAKRAREAAGQEATARKMKAMAQTMRNLAAAMESGEATHLDGVRMGTHVETLDSMARGAMTYWIRDRKMGMMEREKTEAGGPTAEMMDATRIPYPYLDKSTLMDLVAKGRETPGAKLLAERVAKIRMNENEGQAVTLRTDSELDDVKELSQKVTERGKPVWDTIKWKFETYDRLKAMGLTNLPSLRAALREFLQYRGQAAKADPIKAMERELIGMKLPGFFPTPRPVIDEMIGMAGIEPGMKVLEPSAGKGDIAEAAQEAGAEVDAIELSIRLQNILKAKGLNVIDSDFTSREPVAEYDAVVMNPPFENGQDIEHVRHAYKFLKPGGKLVAIMSAGPFYRQDKQATAFREWLDGLDSSHEAMPEGSFAGSDAFRQTGVRTQMVTITKPANKGQPALALPPGGVTKSQFNDKLDELQTLDLEDDQFTMPKFNAAKDKFVDTIVTGEAHLMVRGKDEVSPYGAHELFIVDNDDTPIGFARLTKNPTQISINMIHVDEDYRGRGIGSEFYRYWLDQGVSVKSDKEITDGTVAIYQKLASEGYGMDIQDGRAVLLPKAQPALALPPGQPAVTAGRESLTLSDAISQIENYTENELDTDYWPEDLRDIAQERLDHLEEDYIVAQDWYPQAVKKLVADYEKSEVPADLAREAWWAAGNDGPIPGPEVELNKKLLDELEEWAASDEARAAALAEYLPAVKDRVADTIRQIEATGRYKWNKKTHIFDETDPDDTKVLYMPPAPEGGQAAEAEPGQTDADMEAFIAEQQAIAEAEEAARQALLNDPDAIDAVQASGKMSGRNLSKQFEYPEARAVYQALTAARDMLGGPETVQLDKLHKWAKETFESDPAKYVEWAADMAEDNKLLDVDEQAVLGQAFQFLTREARLTGDKNIRALLNKVGNYYLDTGTRLAQAMSARRDPLETPQERWTKALDIVFGPSEAVRRKLRILPTQAGKARRIASLEAELAEARGSRRADVEAALKTARAQETKEELLEKDDAKSEKIKQAVLKNMGVTEDDLMLSGTDRHALQSAILDLPAVKEGLDAYKGKDNDGYNIMRLAFRGFSDEHIANALNLNQDDVGKFIHDATAAIIRPAVAAQVKAGTGFGGLIKAGFAKLKKAVGLGLPPRMAGQAALDKEYMDAVEAGDMEKAQRMVDEAAKAAGYDRKLFHGTNATETVEGESTSGSAKAIENLKALAERVGLREWYGATSVYQRLADNGQMGVTQEDAANAKKWQAEATGTYEPSREKLSFDVFSPPSGELELGVHLGNESAAAMFGEVFPFFAKLGKPFRLPDLGTWNYQSVMRELRKRGVKISESEYDAVFNANDNNAALRELLQSKGIESIVYRNEAEGEGDSFIAFEPSQIKSADPVTRDESGEVIPLSQRFNPKSDSILRLPPKAIEAQPALLGGKRQTVADVTAEVNRVMAYALQSAKARNSGKLMSKVVMTPGGQRVRVFVPFDPDDMANYYAFAREYTAAKASAFDKVYEYWINWPLLSGPQTQVANITGNAAQVAWHYTGQRLAEATLNLAYQDPNAPQFREFKHILKGFWQGIGPAFEMARQTFLTEGDTIRHKYLGQPLEIDVVDGDLDKVGNIRASVGGQAGRISRLPGRVLRFTDAFFKTAIMYAEASAVAYRRTHVEAKRQGLKGQARAAFIDTEIANTLNDTSSAVWGEVMKTAEDLFFQGNNSATEFVDTVLGGYKGIKDLEKLLAEAEAKGDSDAVAELNKRIRARKFIGSLMRWIFPFQRTPTNIIRTGIKKAGGSAISLLYGLTRAGWLAMGKDGVPMIKSYSKAAQIKDASETLLAGLGWLALASMLEGDDNDDEKPVLLVGTRSHSLKERAATDQFLRKYGGENSIVWQDGNGKVLGSLPFGRYEPAATTLTTWIDAYRNYQEVKRLKSQGENASYTTYMLSSLVSSMEDKSFLQGFANAMQFIRDVEEKRENPDQSAGLKMLMNNVVPNLIKQPLRNMDDVLRERTTAGTGYAALPNPAMAPKLPVFAAQPKISTTGERLPKAFTPPVRLLFQANTKVTPQPDALLYRANRLHPTKRWSPQPLQRDDYNADPPGKAKPVPITDPAKKRQFAELAGRLYASNAAKVAAKAMPSEKAAPGESLIKAFKKAREDAMAAARAQAHAMGLHKATATP